MVFSRSSAVLDSQDITSRKLQDYTSTHWPLYVLTSDSKILDQVGITDPQFQNKLNGIIGLTNWIEATFFAFMVDQLGRRPLFLVSNTGMLFTFMTWIILTAFQNNTGNPGDGKGVIVMIFFHNFFYNLCWVYVVSYACPK